MSAKERRRAVIMAGVQAGELNLVGAAAVLGLSYRQTKRVWRRYRAAGDAGLVHRLRGRPGLRRKAPELRAQILARVATRYADFGPTLAAEYLAQEGWRVDHETLLRCLAGIAAPDTGDIYFDDQEFRRDRLDLRQRFFVLPDFPFLFWDQTVLRNLAIILRLYHADGNNAEERVLELLREFDLLPLALRPVQTLSRGQAYKAGLVALLAVDREVWLLDEPFASGMDPHGIDTFKRHARAATARGRTIFYSTQLLDVAERFSDRVCVIHEGEIHAFDTMHRLREQARDKANVLEEMFRRLRPASE